MECIPRNPTRLLAQLHKHPYKRGKRKEKVNTTTCLLLSLCVHFSFTCRNLVCSLIFFFFCFQTESPFFFVFASLLPTSVKLRTRLAWSTYLQRNAKKKKKKNNSNSNKGACRSSALIIPSTLSSSCVPFSPFLRKSPIQSFFFLFPRSYCCFILLLFTSGLLLSAVRTSHRFLLVFEHLNPIHNHT